MDRSCATSVATDFFANQGQRPRAFRWTRVLVLSALLLAVLAALGPSMPASAATLFVDDSYAADNPGSSQWTRIQRAINNASNGDTIYIYSGSYTESVTVNKTLNIQGQSRNDTIIDPPLGNAFNIISNNVNLSSFKVTGAAFGVSIGSGVVNLNIDSVTFEANTRGVNTLLATNVTVTGSYFGNHSGFSNAGVQASRSANITLKNNTFVGNYYGVFFDRTVTSILRDSEMSGNRQGFFLSQTTATVVDRNHVGNSTANGIGGNLDNDHNSTISSNRIDNITGICLYLSYSFSQTLVGNDLSSCYYDLEISPASDLTGVYYGHSIASSNLVEGKPVYYYVNTTSVVVPSGAGWVFASNVTGLTVPPQTMSHQRYGVLLVRVTNATVTGLSFSSPYTNAVMYGVFSYTTTNLTLTGVNGTGYVYGSYHYYSTGLTVQNGVINGPSALPNYYALGVVVNYGSGARVLNNTINHAIAMQFSSHDSPLVQNNTLNDTYYGFYTSSSPYGRIQANTVTNSTRPVIVWGGSLSHFQWTITADNTWEGRIFRSFINSSGTVIGSNFSWLLLANVTNVSAAAYSPNNGTETSGVVAFSSNVTFSSVSFNDSSTGFYVVFSQRVNVFRSTSNNTSVTFLIDTSDDVSIFNATATNVTYEFLSVYSASRVLLQNVSSSSWGADYFAEGYSVNALRLENVTSSGTYTFLYLDTPANLSLNRVSATARGIPSTYGDSAVNVYSATDMNITNSTFSEYYTGLYLQYATVNLRVVNVTFTNATTGIYSTDGSSSNYTISLARFDFFDGAGQTALELMFVQVRLVLTGLNITNYTTGILVATVSNLTVSGSQINNTETGMDIEYVADSLVTGNRLSDIDRTGIFAGGDVNMTISMNNITNAGDAAIYLGDSTNLTVTGNNIQLGNDGIRLNYGRGHLVSGNTVNGTAETGILVEGSHVSSTFNSNTITNGWLGFGLEYVSFMTLDSNVISGNTYNFRLSAFSIQHFWHRINTTNTVDSKPIHLILNASGGSVPVGSGLAILANVSGYSVLGQTISNEWNGILLYQVTGIDILGVTVSNSHTGIYGRSVVNSTLKSSTIQGGSYGTLFEQSTNVSIQGNTFELVRYNSLQVYSTRNSLIDNNLFNGSSSGLYLGNSDVVSITRNRFTNQTGNAFSLEYSSGDVLYNNTLTDNFASFSIYGNSLPHYSHTIPSNNTIQGRPIFYRINTSNIVAPVNSAMVIFANVTNGTVDGLTLERVGQGIAVFGSRFVNISNTTFGSGYTGAQFYANQDVRIRNITTNASACCAYTLISLDYGNANVTFSDSVIPQSYTLFNVYMSNNITLRNLTLGSLDNFTVVYSVFSGYGRINNVTIEDNNFRYAQNSIYMYGYGPSDMVTNVTIANNTFGYYSWAPITVANPYVSNVTAYHNNFDETYSASGYNVMDDPYDVIVWYRAYPWGGNYWSSTTSPDDYNGALQSSLGADGIVDNPYAATPYAYDVYPLADPWPPSIVLISPENRSAIAPGAVLDFAVSFYFDTVKYSIDNGTLEDFKPPFDIDTSGWSEGVYTVFISASDALAPSSSRTFVFAVDTTPPVISAASPSPGGLYFAGIDLNFTITDLHVANNATYDLGYGPIGFSSEWNISTLYWGEGYFNITVDAWDTAGNHNSSTFFYRIDGYEPTVWLDYPSNGSVVGNPGTLYFSVYDTFLQNVTWTNGTTWYNLTDPYDISTAGWPDGPVNISVRALDQLGRSTTLEVTFIIDGTAPIVTLDSPSEGAVIVAGTTLDFSVAEPHLADVQWNNGSNWFVFSDPYDISTAGWQDGDFSVSIFAQDTAGNVFFQSFSITIDSTPPAITLNTPANHSVIAAGTTLDLSVSDLHLDTATWNDGSGAVSFSSPFDISTSGWTDGAKNITVIATDTAGNSRTRVFGFTLDSTQPTVTLSTPANNSVIAAGTTIDLAVTDANLNSVTYDRGLGTTSLSSPFDITTVGWGDGSTNVTVVALDLAGNSRTRVFTFILDSTRPTIALNAPANNSVITSGTTLDFLVTDANGFSATWNNGSGALVLASPFDVSTSGWLDGTFSVTIIATDVAGNSRTSAFVFTLDSTSPTVTLNSPANNSYLPAGRTLDLSVSDAHLSGATWNNGSGAVAFSSPFDIATTAWADGVTNVTVIATDQAGNVRNIVFRFTFDSTLPTVTLNTPANNSVKLPGVVLDFSVSDTNLNNAIWNNGSGNLSLTTPYDISTTGWLDGTYSVTVTALDLAGNTRSFVLVVSLDSVAPSISLNQPTNGSIIGAGTTLDIAVSDLHFANASWNNGSSPNALSNPFDIDTTGWTDGDYTVAINATDAAGNSAFASFNFQIDNAFPAIILISPANNSVIVPGTELDFDVVDADLNVTTWDNGSGPQTFTAPYNISTTGWADGHVNVTIVSIDFSLHIVSVSFHFVIDSVAPVITLNSPANGSVIAGGTAIDLSVAELNIGSVTWNNGSGPVALPAPYDVPTGGWADGTYSLSIVALDLAGNSGSESFTYTIDSTAPTITLTSPANNSVIVAGTTLDFSLSDTHSFSATWNNGSGAVPFTSGFDVLTAGWLDGDFDVAVRATDIAGNLRALSFHFTIDSTLPVVNLTSPANNSVIAAGTVIDIEIVELHLAGVIWNNGSGSVALTTPFDISTSGWADGATSVTVTATDAAGNVRSRVFVFTFDSAPPVITLNTPSNNSVIVAGTTLDFAVADSNIGAVTRNNGTGAVSLASPFDLSTAGWSDGPVDVEIVALDLAGNTASRTFHWTVDSTPPTIALNAPANNSVIPAGTTLDLTVADTNLGTVTWNNGSGALTLSSPFDITTAGWADGLTSVTVIATDLAGNTLQRVFLFTFDSTMPAVSLVTPANNSLVKTGTTLDFQVTDSNLASVTWNNGSGALGLVSPFDVSTDAWADGDTNVTIVAVDAAGNSRTVRFHFTLDGTAPNVSLAAPANNSVIRAGTTLDVAVSDLNGVGTVTWNDSSGAVALASPYDISTSSFADGPVTIEIVALDLAGNSRRVTFAFVIDSTAPAVLLNTPANNSVIRPGVLLDFTVSDLNGLANVTWSNGSSPQNFSAPYDIITSGWPEGIVNVSVAAVDTAGNNRLLVFRFTIDATLPVISLNSPANNSVVAVGTTIDIEIVELHLTSASWNNSSGPVTFATPFDIATSSWGNGTFNVVVFAIDAAGNNATVTFRLTLDSSAPNITLVAPANNSIIAAGVVLDLLILEPNLNNASWNNGSGPASLTAPFDISTAGWADGLVTVTVSVTDLAGNSRTASFRFTMDSTVPGVSLNTPANNSVIASGTDLDFDASDTNLDSVSWNNGSGSNPLPTPYDVSTLYWAEGGRNVTVTATDLAGNTRVVVFRFTFDNTAPTVTLVSPANNSIILAGTTIDLTITDLNLQGATWNNGSGSNALPSPFDITTAGWPDGAYNVTVVATDLAGNSRTVVLRYTFDTTAPAMTLLSPSNNSFVRGGTVLDLLITDLTALTVTWDNGSGPNTLASPFDISTAGWPDGPVDVTVSATDAVGLSRVRVFHFTFDSVLPSVSMISPANNSYIRPGVSLDFSISDTNLNTATWDTGSGASTFVTQWNISTTSWADGSVNITVDATDLAGNVRTRVFHVTIDSVLPSVSLTSPTNNSYIVAGTTISLSISDTNLNTATWDDGSGAQSFATQWTIATTGWSDGPVDITVAALDLAGNTRTRIFHFTIDSTLPVLTLLSPANNSYMPAGIVINFTISDTNFNSATWDNGGGAQSFATSWNISTAGWSDGAVDIAVTVNDLALNARTRTFHFTIDSTLPTVNLIGPTNNTYIVAGTSINFTIADATLDLTSWESSAGGGPQSFATQWNISTATWVDGSYNLTVRASDLAGNVRFRFYQFWVDSTLPTIQLSAGFPGNNTHFDQRNNTQVQFDIVEAALLSATWNYGAGPTAFTAPFAVPVSTWPDAVYIMTVVATDRAGNSVTRWFNFTLDSVAPVIFPVAWEDTYFSAGTMLNGTVFDLNLNWSHVWIDGTAGVNNSASSYSLSTATLIDGTHTLHVEVSDRCGHITTQDFQFQIDSTPPQITTITPADGSHVPRGTPITITATDSNLLNVTWQRDGGPIQPATGVGMPKTISTATWLDGTYLVHIIVRDPAGHRDEVNITIVIDSTLPTLPLLPPLQTYNEDADVVINGSSISDGPNSIPAANIVWTFSVRKGPLALDQRFGTNPTYRWSDPGDYDYNLTITDLAGNVVSSNYTVQINDVTIPTNSLVVPLTVDEDMPVAFTGSASRDNDYMFLRNVTNCGGAFYTVIDSSGASTNLPLSSTTGGVAYSCLDTSHTFAEPGLYTVRLTIFDPTGLSNTASLVVTVRDRTPPVLTTVTVTPRANEGDNVTFEALGVTDNDAQNLSAVTYQWVVKSGATVVDTLLGSPASRVFATAGGFTVNVTARDVSGNSASREFPLYVNDIPGLLTTLDNAVTSGETYVYTLLVADTDTGDTHNATFTSPSGILQTRLGDGRIQIEWTPTGYGPDAWNFTLSDGWSTVRIVVPMNKSLPTDPTNDPPEFTSEPIQELVASQRYNYDVNAQDPELRAIYFGLAASPPGMSIDTGTGIITWTHGLLPNSTEQTFNVDVTAWDGLNTAHQVFTLRFRPGVNAAPTIDGPSAWDPITTVEQGKEVSEAIGAKIDDADDAVAGLAIEVTSSNPSIVEIRLEGAGAGTRVYFRGLATGTVTVSIHVEDASGKDAYRNYTMTVTAPSNTQLPGGDGGMGILPLIGLAVAGGGAAGFFFLVRSRNKKKEQANAAALAAAAQAERVSAVQAPTVAAGAGTVVVTPEAAAAASAAAMVAAAPAEKKITYTIEGLFVIYKDGRMLYAKTDMGQAKFEDPELVSSMFTAVTSFIKDSFQAEGELNKMGYGDNQIIIERGRSVFMAAIVFGEPDQEFHDAMKAAIETMELSYAGMIEEWDGMMDHFADMESKIIGITSLTAGITRREVQMATTKQEVLMLSELEFFQGFVRLKCGIKNNTPSVITKATVDIEYNEDVLRLARVEPAAYRTSGAKVLLGVLNPGEKSSVAYYFDPQICTESQIDGVCRYRDASGVLHTVAMKTRKAEVVCPLFFTKEHANTAMLKRLVEAELGEKDSKVFEIQKIPPYIKHKDVFDLIKSVVNAHDVQMVREFTKYNPFHGEAWFYGETKVKGYKIVIRATVIEETNAIEFFAASTNMKAITGLLAEFNHTLNSMVIEKYSDLKIAQIFDSATKAEIEKKSLMSNMSSADLAGGETEQAGQAPAEGGGGAPPFDPAAPGEQPPQGGDANTPPPDQGGDGEGPSSGGA